MQEFFFLFGEKTEAAQPEKASDCAAGRGMADRAVRGYLWVPRKNSDSTPGPACEPITAPV